jgi:hypothetical protein
MTKKGKLDNNSVKLFLDPDLAQLALSNCESILFFFFFFLCVCANIHFFAALDSSSLNLIPETCTNLVTLSLNGCGKLSNETLDLVSYNNKTNKILILKFNEYKITKKCPLLEELTLQGSYRISDDSMIRFVEAHPFLKKLELWWLNRLTSRFSQRLSAACPGLRNLHIILCPQVDNECMYFLYFFYFWNC